MDDFHTPVLLKEAVETLNVKKGEKYIDCTLGGGGHSRAIIDKGGILLSIDQDEEAIRYVNELRIKNYELKIKNKEWILYKGNFANIEEIAKESGFVDVAGILFDLGVSSHQFEDKTRGFSFDSTQELDMRMDKDLNVKASVLVNGLSKKELANIFASYGEEQFAIKIAGDIEYARKTKPIVTCRELSEICRRVYLKYEGFGARIHPATRVFQALRIVVNDEVGSLEEGITGGFNILKNKGRMAVISFHSIEDRIVKNFYRKCEEGKKGKIVTEEIVRADEKEVINNPKARSAKLRVLEKNYV